MRALPGRDGVPSGTAAVCLAWLAAPLLFAALLWGQAPPRAPARAPSPALPVPAVQDLKFPPLRPIQIPNVASFTLPNGMKLYLLEDHELPLIDGVARIRTGNLFDPPDKIGLATLTGIVMRTGGTRNKTGDQLDQELESLAADVESSIGEGSGTVSFNALKENTDEVLGAFHDVLTSPEFRQDKIDLAKDQLRSGIARQNDDAHGVVEREFTDIVYGKDTPYGWDMKFATIKRIGRDDLINFYTRYVFPSNVMLAVWGDFNAADMKAKIERLFAGWNVAQPPVPAFPAVRNTPAPGVYLAVKSDVAQTFFAIGQLGGELRDKDYPALEVMSDILGGGFRSRLFQRVRTRMGNAYDIDADWGANYDHPGLFEISGSTKSASTVETIKAIREEVERIRTSPVTDEELDTAKQATLNSLVFAFDTKSKTLGRVLAYEYYGYPKDFIQQYQKALAAVTKADVLRVAKQRLKPELFTVVTVGNPKEFAQPLDLLGGPVKMIDLTIPEDKAEARQ
jgi:zinc protease